MILTLENVVTLPTEELQEIVWEMHKDITGVRPRHMSTRDDYLSWLQYELQPEVLIQRQVERADEDAYWDHMAATEFQDMTEQREMFDYPGMNYEHLEEVKWNKKVLRC